jgi:hypothetical protein
MPFFAFFHASAVMRKRSLFIAERKNGRKKPSAETILLRPGREHGPDFTSSKRRVGARQLLKKNEQKIVKKCWQFIV